MLLAMRRESEPHHAATTPTTPSTANAVDVTAVVSASSATQSNASVTTNGLVVPSVSSALQLSPSLSIAVNATSCTTQYHHLQLQQQQQHAELQQHVEQLQQQQADSLNTPTTPLLNLGRSPLQFPPPPPPPVPVQAGPQFGFYTPNTGAATYLHPHYPHPSVVPTSAGTSLVSINTGNASLANSSSQRSSSVQSTELDEYVDILQVQQLLLDSSASASQQALAAANSGNTNGTTATPSPQQSLPKPRPRLNLQKATEYAAQVQAENQSSRRMLLDYPSPYLYGNHYHTSPSEDLVALWFGSNGSGYDGARAMSGEFEGCAAIVQNSGLDAPYLHCATDNLNVAICHACDIAPIHNYLGTVKKVFSFFRNCNKAGIILKQHIVESKTGAKQTRLLKFCETRWIEHLASLNLFYDSIEFIAFALEEMDDLKVKSDGVQPNELLAATQTPQFIISSTVLKPIFGLTKCLSLNLQKEDCDLSDCIEYANDVHDEIKDMRTKAD